MPACAAGVGKIMRWLPQVCATTLLLKISHIIDMPPPSTPVKKMGLKVALPMTREIPLRQTFTQACLGRFPPTH